MFNWQWILVMVGAPGLLAALLFLFVKEPPRRNPPDAQHAGARRRLVRPQGSRVHGLGRAEGDLAAQARFLPLFAALALSAVESQGLPAVARAVHLAHLRLDRERRSAALLGPLLLVAMLAGITVGGVFVIVARQAPQGCQHPRHRDHLRLHHGGHDRHAR